MSYNMKQYSLALGIVLLLLGNVSCSDWLDVKPKSEIKGDELFKTEAGFKDALTGAYILMTDTRLYGQELTFGFIEALGQQFDVDHTTNNYNYCMQYQYEKQDVFNRIDGIWSASYNVIANINNILKNLKANGEVLTPEEYNRIKGECLGLRAFLHFDLLRLFGWGNLKYRPEILNRLCIPYVLDYDKEVTEQATVKGVLDYIEADLREADRLLPHKVTRTTYSFTYYALLGLRARVAMWRGDFTKALEYAEEIIARENEYPWINKGYLETNKLEERDFTFFNEYLFGLSIYQFTDLTEKYFEPLVDITRTNPQYLFLNAQRGKDLFEVGDNTGAGDYRRLWVMDYSGTQWKFLKYKQAERSKYLNRIPLMKKAEFYYTAAECLNETNLPQNREKAIGYLNTVREHRGITRKLETDLDKTAVQQEIMKEWKKELLLEGQMFFYYKRLGIVNLPNTSVSMNDDTYVMPLPQAEIEFGGRTENK